MAARIHSKEARDGGGLGKKADTPTLKPSCLLSESYRAIPVVAGTGNDGESHTDPVGILTENFPVITSPSDQKRQLCLFGPSQLHGALWLS